MKHKISAFLLTIMLLAQIGLAQHASVHFLEPGQQSHTTQHQLDPHGNDQEPHKKASDSCQICISAKVFSHGLTSSTAIILPISLFSETVISSTDQITGDITYLSAQPRGPPALLI